MSLGLYHFVRCLHDILPIRVATKMRQMNYFICNNNFKLFTGVITAKINNGAADNPRSHRHPNVGATANANTTSKHAPNAQKH